MSQAENDEVKTGFLFYNSTIYLDVLVRPGCGMASWQATEGFGPKAWTFAPAPGREPTHPTNHNTLKGGEGCAQANV